MLFRGIFNMIRPRDSEGSPVHGPAGNRGAGLNWLQQATTFVYFLAGVYLIYQHFKRLHRQAILIAGILFVLYSVYRFFLVRRYTGR